MKNSYLDQLSDPPFLEGFPLFWFAVQGLFWVLFALGEYLRAVENQMPPR